MRIARKEEEVCLLLIISTRLSKLVAVVVVEDLEWCQIHHNPPRIGIYFFLLSHISQGFIFQPNNLAEANSTFS